MVRTAEVDTAARRAGTSGRSVLELYVRTRRAQRNNAAARDRRS